VAFASDGGELAALYALQRLRRPDLDDWRKLPEEERDEWEPADDEAVWYTRKSW
jgi:hypothetical protein